MDKLIAVKVEGREGALKVTGYASRGKNRRVLWVLDGTGKTKAQILLEVEGVERKRLDPSKE